MYLTQTGGILGPIAKLLGYIINIIFEGLSAIGIHNVGLTIILFTLVTKIIMLPMTVKQQKFTKINGIMQPEINKIQKKYRGKKDQASAVKQNEEIQAVYAKYGTSTTASCLPLLIQLPIMLTLYRVIYNIPAYVNQIKVLYMNIVTPLQQVDGYTEKLLAIKETAKLSRAGLEAGAAPEKVVDFLYNFRSDTWELLRDAFSTSPEVVSAIGENANKIIDYNQFIFGINIAESPMQGGLFSPYLLIPVFAALFQFISAKTMNTAPVDDSNPAAGMTKSMTYYMPIMSFVFCLTLPSGVGIYWGIGAFFQFIQQIVINKYLDRVDMDAFIEKNKEKAAAKAAKGKKSLTQRMLEGQSSATQEEEKQTGTRKMSDIASINTKKVNNNYTSSKRNYESDSDDENTQDQSNNAYNAKPGSIASKANVMLNYNNKSNNKGGQ